MTDPFADLENEVALDRVGTRGALLDRALRGYVPLRKEFVQLHDKADDGTRGSVLGQLLADRQERALDALLLLHALWPAIDGDAEPLPMSQWALMLTTDHGGECTPNAASKAFTELEKRGLVRRESVGRGTRITPCREDGSGDDWENPGTNPSDRYFTVPHLYWIDPIVDGSTPADALRLPGKAMLLIALKETQDPGKPGRFSVAAARGEEWYGISERSVERGYGELRKAKLLAERTQRVRNPKASNGIQTICWRAPTQGFSTDDRAKLQAEAVSKARAKITARAKSGPVKPTPEPDAKPKPKPKPTRKGKPNLQRIRPVRRSRRTAPDPGTAAAANHREEEVNG
ncbi:hypothetical protein [Cryptosporangium arvum]|uniref:Uncharacterized protein n=1 Tax=Cryptosporangium arvum DSM 44712 TaxID=927661 RepID=A0A010ZUC4_9ACTN|nr:hypothetical protein [Cryptosporangium arvum]EXG80792.1 hypothetical protein CryarDRAFT_1884 [Cryptosporangium arvum DSM 44712]